MIEPLFGPRARNLKFREAVQVQNADSFGNRRAFLGHGIIPTGALKPAVIVGIVTGTREPCRAFPTAPVAEQGTLCGQSIIKGGCFHGAPCRPFKIGQVHSVLVGINFNSPRLTIFWRGVVGEAARVAGPHVPFGLALRNPFG